MKQEFVKWIENKSSKPFSIENEALLVFLDENIDLIKNTKVNGVKVELIQTQEELFRQLLTGWISTSRLFLEVPESRVSMNFRQVQIPQSLDVRLRLLNEVLELGNLCLD